MEYPFPRLRGKAEDGGRSDNVFLLPNPPGKRGTGLRQFGSKTWRCACGDESKLPSARAHPVLLYDTSTPAEISIMQLTDLQIQEFNEQGYLFLPSVFTPEEMDVLNGEVPHILAEQREEVVREKGSDAPRSAFYVQT